MKQDYFSANNIKYIDYKNLDILRKFLDLNGRIINHRRTGITMKNQRALANAVKIARFFGLLPYVAR